MRLIDADAFLKRNEVYADCEFIHPMYQNTLKEIVDEEPTIAAPRWVRCEEPPKKDGKYLVCWKDSGGFCWDSAWWTSVGTWSLSHWTGVTVTHWMTVEPPKEE